MQEQDATLDEGCVNVVLRPRVGVLELLFCRKARRTERRGHEDDIESCAQQVDKRDSLGGVARKEPTPYTGAVCGGFREVPECLHYTHLGLVEETVVVDAREIQLALSPHRLHAWEKARALPLLHELLACPAQLRGDPLLDGNKRAELSGKPHLTHHLPEEIAQERRMEPCCKLLDEHRVARHWLRHDDVGTAHGRPLRRWDSKILPGPLGSQPERERGDLRRTRIDVYTVKVVLEDERRHREPEMLEIWIVLAQRPAGLVTARARRFNLPRLLIDHQQKVEAVEQEMARAAGRVENAQIARILPRTSSRHLFFAPPEVMDPLPKDTALAVHLEPRPPERVVHEELDDIAGREELVADGQLATVARCLALIAHPLSLFAGIEELIDPTDGL